MEPNLDNSSDESTQQDFNSKNTISQSLESGDGSPKTTRQQPGKEDPTAEMEPNLDNSADESTQPDFNSKNTISQSLESGDGSPKTTRQQPGKEDPTAESVLTKETTLTSPSAEKERFDEKFVEDIRARIDEVSTRESSDFSPEDMEVFQNPMCLVSTEGETLELDERTVKEINKISWPMIIVAVVGLFRTGKSYLMNMLAGSKNGFAVGNTIQPITKGLWVLCVIHPKKPNTVLLLIDTEGFGDSEKGDPNHDNKIFSLATLLCNCLVYNMKDAFNQESVSKLTFITEMTKHIRFRKTPSQENENLRLILSEFLLCLRDFQFQLIKDGKDITADEYLEDCLKEQKGKDDTFNKPRECIKKYFPMRKCFIFPTPCGPEVLRNQDTLSFDDLSDSFKDTRTCFVSYVYSLEPKELLASKPINGLMFTTLANHYVTAIRHGAIPDVDDAFLATAKIESKRIKDNALKIFEDSMAEIILPVPSTNLDDIYTRAQSETLGYLRKNVVHDRDGLFEITTQSAMDAIWKEYKKKIIVKIVGLCHEKIHDAFKSLKENIDKKVYEEAGGHKKFQRDVSLMKKEFMCFFRDYKDNEISSAWLAFLETLKTTESKIIEADDHLSKKEKEDEKRLNEERIKKLIEEHERNKTELIEEQRKLLQEHHDNLKKEREIQAKVEQERYKEFLQVKSEKEHMKIEMEKMKQEHKEREIKFEEEQEKQKELFKVTLEEIEQMKKEMERMKQEVEERKQRWLAKRLYDAFLNQ